MNINKAATVCFSGHREIPKGKELFLLEKRLTEEINKAVSEGFDTFIFGGALGWDLLCGSKALFRRFLVKQYDPIIQVIAIVPFENQAIHWKVDEQEEYHNLLSKCDEVITLSTHYGEKVYRDRNQFMVSHSARLICYWNGNIRSGTGQTINMANKAGIQIINLHENETS